MGRYSAQNTFLSTPSWPTSFPKEVIGIERNGIVIRQQETPSNIEEMEFIPESLEAIKLMRMKGYNVIFFFNEPKILGNQSHLQVVENSNTKMMEVFGNHGIMSINGLYFSTSNLKDDIYALPNNGMLKKAEAEMNLKFKGGYFVGDKLQDLKAGDSLHSNPILIQQGLYEETQKKLNTFANKKLKSKVKEYKTLLDFAMSLK